MLGNIDPKLPGWFQCALAIATGVVDAVLGKRAKGSGRPKVAPSSLPESGARPCDAADPDTLTTIRCPLRLFSDLECEPCDETPGKCGCPKNITKPVVLVILCDLGESRPMSRRGRFYAALPPAHGCVVGSFRSILIDRVSQFHLRQFQPSAKFADGAAESHVHCLRCLSHLKSISCL